MEGEIHGLFPTPVGRYKLGRSFSKKELKFINSQELSANQGNKTSVDRYLFKHKTLSKLKKFSEECTKHYFENIFCPKNSVSLRITQSWVNFTKKGEYHHAHKHPNSFIAGVLYIEADAEKDRILFASSNLTGIMEITPMTYNPFNSKDWWLPVGTGELIIFPATLTHSVPPTETENRISLSFNTFPVGYVGDEFSLTALHL